MSYSARKSMIDVSHPLSIYAQCAVLGVSRSSHYYKCGTENEENLALMRLIDEQYMKTPFYGHRRMCAHLRSLDYTINPKRVLRLMQVMGLSAVYPKKNLSKSNKLHKKHPYLLRGLAIETCNQVWSTDINYIPMECGFMYLVAVIDWFSRYILSWKLSNSLDD